MRSEKTRRVGPTMSSLSGLDTHSSSESDVVLPLSLSVSSLTFGRARLVRWSAVATVVGSDLVPFRGRKFNYTRHPPVACTRLPNLTTPGPDYKLSLLHSSGFRCNLTLSYYNFYFKWRDSFSIIIVLFIQHLFRQSRITNPDLTDLRLAP